MDSQTNLKLGVIDVLNVLPVYYGMVSKRVEAPCELVHGRVTELNRKLNVGEIDVSVISSLEYANHPELYYVFPNLSVGADGPVRSIYLFLDKPITELDGDLIRLTEFSLTSVHLIQYLLKDHQVTFVSGNDENVAGELLIADEAIRRFYQKSDRFVYDLSELWKIRTGLPFVFALWVTRRDVFDRCGRQVNLIYDTLLQSRELSKDLYDQMARERFAGIFPNAAECAEYLKNIHYDLSPDYRLGFRLFQEKLVEIGQLNQIAPLKFITDII